MYNPDVRNWGIKCLPDYWETGCKQLSQINPWRAVYLLVLLGLPFLFFLRGTRMEIMLGDGDAFVQFMPFWKYAADQWKNLTPPFWTPYIFGGYPLFAEPQASIFHPFRFLFLFFSPVAAMNITVLVYYGLAGIFTFLLAKEEGLRDEACLLAGVTYSFCGFLIGHQGITALFITAAAFPAFFYCIRRTLRQPNYMSVLWGALGFLFLILGGHPQFFFYAFFFGFFYALYLAWFVAPPARRIVFIKCVAGIYLLGAAISAFQLLPTYELAALSVRSELTYSEFLWKSMRLGGLLASLISARIYSVFPNDGSEDMLNVGLLVLTLAGIGAVRSWKESKFWVVLALFSMLLVLGNQTHVYRLMYYVPGYNLFRAASRSGIALELSLAMLAGFGLHMVQGSERYSRWKKTVPMVALVGLVYAVFFYWMELRIFRALWRVWNTTGGLLPWKGAGQHLLPLWPELLAILLGAALLSFILLKWGQGQVIALLCVFLVFAQFWPYRRWIFAAPAAKVESSLQAMPFVLPGKVVEEDLKSNHFRAAWGGRSDWINLIRSDRENWREQYVSAGGSDLNMLTGVPTIAGYTPLIPRVHSRLAGGMHMSGYINDPNFFQSPGVNLLNVKYVFVPPADLGFPTDTFSGFEQIGSEGGFTVYRNPEAPGMFWGVTSVKSATEEEFWERLESSSIDFTKAALVMESLPPNLEGNKYIVPERIHFSQIDGNTIEIDVDTAGPAFLASSHPFYPGWFAWLDGQAAELYKVNGAFTGLAVPPGSHTILFRFIPVSLWVGVFLGIAGIFVLAIVSRKDLLRVRLE